MQHDTRAGRALITSACAAAILTGCAKDTASTSPAEPARNTQAVLTPNDFARTNADSKPQSSPKQRLPITLTLEQASEGISDVQIQIAGPEARVSTRVAEPTATNAQGEPTIPGPRASESSTQQASQAQNNPQTQSNQTDPSKANPDQAQQRRATTIDLMVGQVNGQPIYAQEFYTQLDARLRADAQRLPRNQWLQLLRTETDRILFERVRDQLLLDEFDQSLTADQRLGVAAFLERFRTRLVSGNLGSALLADEALQRDEGLTLEEKVEREIDRQVILEQLRREVLRRVNVSFRDVQRYYNQNIERYQPIPTAILRVLRVRLSDEDTLNTVETALASNTDFEKVAEEHSSFRRSSQGQLQVELTSREIATTEFFGIEALNTAVQQLSRNGQITERIDTERDAWWVMLEDLVQPDGRSLYEVQNEIEEQIRAQRFTSAEREYFAELFGRSAVSDLDEMRAKLMTFAVETYLGESIEIRSSSQPN